VRYVIYIYMYIYIYTRPSSSMKQRFGSYIENAGVCSTHRFLLRSYNLHNICGQAFLFQCNLVKYFMCFHVTEISFNKVIHKH
jgi:hypothetical protein